MNSEAHVLECLPISFPLPVVVLLHGLTSLFDATRLEKFDGVVLRRMTHATHAETRVVGHRLDVLLAGDNPTDANSRGLQTLRAGRCDEHIAVV